MGHFGATVEAYPFDEKLWGGAASATDVIAVSEKGVIYRATLP